VSKRRNTSADSAARFLAARKPKARRPIVSVAVEPPRISVAPSLRLVWSNPDDAPVLPPRSFDGHACPYPILPLCCDPDEGGFVYFIRCIGPGGDAPVKIGKTRNLAHRIHTLQNGCPYHICLAAFLCAPDYHTIEEQLHDHFAALRLRGEWFRADPAIDSLIATLVAAQRKTIMGLGVRP
jgi:hypothetical protein